MKRKKQYRRPVIISGKVSARVYWTAAVLSICMLLAGTAVLLLRGGKTDGGALPAAADIQPDTVEEKVVYLTFDDGPSRVTEDVLDYLRGEDIQATFFVIGMETERAGELLARMLAEGHSIGLHSYSHEYQKIYASPDAFFDDQQRLCDYLEPLIGFTPSIFRFPGGSCNSTAESWVLEGIKKRAEEKGLVWYDWNAVAEDSGYTAAPAEAMAQNIISTGGDKKRILVLMHDNSVRTTAVDCLKIIVPYYREKGYAFAPITDETPPIQFKGIK